MGRFPLSSLRARLLLLVLLATVPTLGLILYTASEDRRLATLEAHESLLRLARIASATQAELIEEGRHLLAVLARLPEARGRDPATCNAVFADIRMQFPRYRGVLAAPRMATSSAVACRFAAPPILPIGPISSRPWNAGASPLASM